MDFIVCKFGGSSVASAERLRQIEHILELDNRRRCVVVSAPGKAPGVEVKVTDMLIELTSQCLNEEESTATRKAICDRFLGIYGELGLSNDVINEVLQELERR